MTWELRNNKGDIYILDDVSFDQNFTNLRQVLGLPTPLTAQVVRYEHYTVPECFVFTLPKIKKVIFNDPATIVLWLDGTKTVVKCQEGDEYSKEKGLALCFAKRALGNKSNFNNEFKRWIHD